MIELMYLKMENNSNQLSYNTLHFKLLFVLKARNRKCETIAIVIIYIHVRFYL